MGTTLTGTTPQDTYDSLIKVTDNGPISGTLKALSDGLGNDSTLSLSTIAASIAGTLAVSGDVSIADKIVHIGDTNTAIRFPAADTITFETSGAEAARITSTGIVGIGTSTVSRLLTLKNNAGATNGISFQSLASTSEIASIECNQTLDTIDFEMYSAFAGNGFRFLTGTTLVERARFTANGLTFNGDTAAANALDDYEEGTFTATLVPSTSGSITLSSSFQTALYTKIGREVTVRGYLVVQSVSSPVGGGVFLRGLPFTSNGGGAASVSFFDAPTYAASNLVSYIRTATTEIEIVQSAALVGNDEEYYFTATYFV